MGLQVSTAAQAAPAAPLARLRRRWVSPFRAVWAPAGDAFVVGSLSRCTELYDAGSGVLIAKYASDLMTAIPPRHACHPLLPAIAAATGSGRLHIWRPAN